MSYFMYMLLRRQILMSGNEVLPNSAPYAPLTRT